MNENPKYVSIGISRHRIASDGKGITSLVCSYSCPLRCKYCLNPQSIRESTKTKVYTVEELYQKLSVDNLYFIASNGGVCFGGGEPLLFSDFICEFYKKCCGKWKISIETSLNVKKESVLKLIDCVDEWIVDIKDMNPAIYESYTGKDNKQVIENLSLLCRYGLSDKIKTRVPLIPCYNSESDVEESISKLKEIGISNFDRFTYITNINK